MNNNQQEKTSQKSIWSNLLIIFLVAIIMVTAFIGMYAWAKYQTAINGSATAQVAKWSFKLVDGITETSDVIDFAFTRTDGYEHVEEGKLAPGTFGKFEIGIDARGTETILEYVIDVELDNKPTNLKLYSDSGKTKEIEVTNGKFSIDGFMSLEDVKEIKTVTVYWNWSYETGSTDEEKVDNDVIDTEDAGKDVTMQISVTGTEVLEIPTIIEFSIEGTTYYAEEGMTWEEWVESEYNTGGYYCNAMDYIVNDSVLGTNYSVSYNGSHMVKTHIIEELEYVFDDSLDNTGGSAD